MLDVSSLSEIDLFKHLPDSCLEALEKDGNVLNCSARHLFFQPRQTGKVLFVLEKGSVRTFRTYGDRKLTIAVLQPPAIFGVMGCFGQGRYLSSAEALEESRVHFLHKMETLARKGLIPRLATLLLEKAENGVVAGMTHKELAENLGLHRESITATLGELRRAGIITIERKTIRILQPERLDRAARE